jgi:hypothetical protein
VSRGWQGWNRRITGGLGRFMTISVERGLATKGTAKLVGNRSNEMKYRIAYQQSLRQSYDPWGAV